MAESNQELELYKLVTKEVSEYGWIDEDKFYIWLSHSELSEFIQKFKKIFGDFVFNQDNAIDAHITNFNIVIDLVALVSCEDIELERVFPKEEFKH